jgi:hypothetical protein
MEDLLLQTQNHMRFMCIKTVHLGVLTFLSKRAFKIDGTKIITEMSFFCLNQSSRRMGNIR